MNDRALQKTYLKKNTVPTKKARQKAPLESFVRLQLLKITYGPFKTGKSLTDTEDLRECPLSSRTEKDAVLARQPSSLHTPSHFSVWLVFQIGNYKRKKKKKRRKKKRIETVRQFYYKIKTNIYLKKTVSLSSLFIHEPMLFLSIIFWSERNNFSFWSNSAPAKGVSPIRCTQLHLAQMKNILNWVNMVSKTTVCLSKTVL